MGSRASPTVVSISHCTPVAHTGTSTTRKNQRENPLAAMTASTIPPHEQSDNTDNTESRAHTPPDWWDHHRPITSDEYSDMALMLGALSILTFWMFGLGILLGAAAIGTALAARRPDTPRHDPGDNTAGIVGILTGIAGIAFGAVFLTAALPHL
ncbi:hypothetical protein BS297_17115 [Rhodococcus erythropolis]|uniref:DUF4190 domain-containing protein n=1 Tax=Rhodococcus erythropolis TaxID=1833 RepID=A0A5N5E4I5_RHOER|nr:hypothetical protein BS297_17115 [Rhodococcus erythropolis]